MHYSKPVQDAINYINENLTDDLSLEALAGYVHFSPYHFHRLFLLCTGEAPMEYIRRQRLKAASHEIPLKKFGITEIAAKYSFESQLKKIDTLIVDSQKRVLETMNSLNNQGEIRI